MFTATHTIAHQPSLALVEADTTAPARPPLTQRSQTPVTTGPSASSDSFINSNRVPIPVTLPLELVAAIQRETDHATFIKTLRLARMGLSLPTCADLRARLLELSPSKNSTLNDKVKLLGSFTTLWNNRSAIASYTRSGGPPLTTATPVQSLAFSPNTGALVTADAKRVDVWSFRTRVPKAIPLAPGSVCHPIAFSRDGGLLATGTLTGGLWIWGMDADRPKPESYLPPQGGKLRAITLSDNPRRLLTHTQEKAARVWHIDGKSPHPIMTIDDVSAAALCPQGKLLATAARSGAVTFWDVDTSEPLVHLEHVHTEVFSMAFSDDGLRFASGHRDDSIHLWNVKDGTLLARTSETHMAVFSLNFSPGGHRLVSGDSTCAARLWDVQNPTQSVRIKRDHVNHVTCAAFSPDGRFVATASQDNTVRLWDSEEVSWIGALMSRIRWW